MSVRCLLAVLFLGLLTACAGQNPKDPLEGMNRSFYAFNKGLDTVALKPAAKAYDAVVPSVIDARIDSFVSNLGDVRNTLNSLLQGKFGAAGVSFSRFLLNSSLGLAGLFDPATGMGLEQHPEDFGQTLAVWGVPSGPYLMLPFMGPSTLRDATAKPFPMDVGYNDLIDHIPTRNTVYGLDALNLRQSLFPIDAVLADATDEYAYVREAWLQNRQFKIYDGELPAQSDDCDPEYEEC